MSDFPYIYTWRLRVIWGSDSPLYGRHCRILARVAHNKNSRLIEMENGEQFVISGEPERPIKTASGAIRKCGWNLYPRIGIKSP